MRSSLYTLTVVLTIAAPFALSGCGGNKAETSESEPAPELAAAVKQAEQNAEYQVIKGTKEDFTEPTQFEKNFGLHARAQGPTIILSMRNRNVEAVTISPDDLAIITGPNPQKDLLRVNPGTADLRGFSPIILETGEIGTRRIQLKTISSAAGMRLVYNNPRQGILTFVDIE